MRKGNVFLFAIFFLIFDCFQGSMTLCQSMQYSIHGRKRYDQIWPVLPSSGDILFEVCASQVSDVIAFCSVLLPSNEIHSAINFSIELY